MSEQQFSPEELAAAGNSEQAVFVEAQLEHFKQRAVALRVNLDRVLAENADLRTRLAELEEKAKPPRARTEKRSTPAKKAAAKPPTG